MNVRGTSCTFISFFSIKLNMSIPNMYIHSVDRLLLPFSQLAGSSKRGQTLFAQRIVDQRFCLRNYIYNSCIYLQLAVKHGTGHNTSHRLSSHCHYHCLKYFKKNISFQFYSNCSEICFQHQVRGELLPKAIKNNFFLL